jgi:hypothetical protein
MNRADINANLVVNRGKHSYDVDVHDGVVTVKAKFSAMTALHRELNLKSGQGTFNKLALPLQKMNLSLKWKFGLFRLTLLKPDGPSLLTRILGAR